MRTLLFVALLLAPSAALAKKPAPPPPASWKCGDAVAADYGAANDALQAGRNADAAAAFAGVLAKEPQCGLALLGQGRALLADGKAADALVPLGAASVAFADKLDTYVWLGRARLAVGDDDGALAAARAAIALKAASVDAQKVAQEALLRKKDYAGAHASIEAARAVSNVVTWYCLDGLISAAEGDTAKATELLAACQGVPDQALYDTLAARVAAMPAAPAAASGAAPAAASGAAPAAPPAAAAAPK